MPKIGMQKNSREKPPPFPVRNRDRIHQTGVAKSGTRMSLNPVKETDQEHPPDATPIEQNAF